MAEKDDEGTEPAGLTSSKADSAADGAESPVEAGATEPVTAEPATAEPEQPADPEPGQPAAELPPAPPITGFPKAGVEPVVVGGGAERPQAPGPVRAAFVLTIVAAVVLLVGQVVTILFKQQLIDQAVKSVPRGQKVDVAAIESNASVLVWALFVGALCFGAIMVLFAYKAREGTRSARTVVTVLAILGLVFQLAIVRSIFSVVSSVLLVVLVILLYVPSTRDFFPKLPKKL